MALKPELQVQTAEGTSNVLKLELVLQTAGNAPNGIREKVGDSEVAISLP